MRLAAFNAALVLLAVSCSCIDGRQLYALNITTGSPTAAEKDISSPNGPPISPSGISPIQSPPLPPDSPVTVDNSKKAATTDPLAPPTPSPPPTPSGPPPPPPPPDNFIVNVWQSVFQGLGKLNQWGAVTVLGLLSFWSQMVNGLTGQPKIVACSVDPVLGLGDYGGCQFYNPGWIKLGR